MGGQVAGKGARRFKRKREEKENLNENSNKKEPQSRQETIAAHREGRFELVNYIFVQWHPLRKFLSSLKPIHNF